MENKGYRALMISVLAQAITDYIQAVRVAGLDFRKKLKKVSFDLDLTDILQGVKIIRSPKERLDIEAMTRGEEAKTYIFEDSKEYRVYVFGFTFICTYLGIDPGRFRKRIKEKREEFWRDIYQKVKEM